MLKAINGVLGALCLVVLSSEVLAATEVPGAAHSPAAAVSDGVDLSQALSLATDRVGGRVVDAKLGAHKGRRTWEVVMEQGGKTVRLWVDARTGEIEVDKDH